MPLAMRCAASCSATSKARRAYAHGGEPADDRRVGAPFVRRQEPREGGRPRHEHRRDGLLRGDGRAHGRPPRQITEAAMTNTHLLLVEDDRALADLVAFHFEPAGYDVTRTGDGEE